MYVPGRGHFRRSLLTLLDHYLDAKLASGGKKTPVPAPTASVLEDPELDESVWEFASRTGLLGDYSTRGFGTFTLAPGCDASTTQASLTVWEDGLLHGINLIGLAHPENVIITGVTVAGLSLPGLPSLNDRGISWETARDILKFRREGNLWLRTGQVITIHFTHAGSPQAPAATVHADLVYRRMVLPAPVQMLKDLQAYEAVTGGLPPAWAATCAGVG